MITLILVGVAGALGWFAYMDRAALVADVKTEVANVEAEVAKLAPTVSADARAAVAKLTALL
jgi:hypothetical protein